MEQQQQTPAAATAAAPTTRPVPVVEGVPNLGTWAREYVRRHRPILLKGAAKQLLPKAWKLFHGPEGEGTPLSRPWLLRLEEIVGEDTVIDVAHTHWALPFAGDPNMAQAARMTFGDFACFIAQQPPPGVEVDDDGMYADEDGYACGEGGGSNLYLAQAPIYERPRKGQKGQKGKGGGEGGGGEAPPLAALEPYIDMPTQLVKFEEIVAVNLWVGGRPTATTLHYDSNHNLLAVLRGAKQVQLFPPSATPGLEAGPVYSTSANHSRIPVPAQRGDLFRLPRLGETPCPPWVARVEEGDVLFIPEGWWHQVDSEGNTAALNYWWAGFVEEVLDGGNEWEEDEAAVRAALGLGPAEPREEDGDGESDEDRMLQFYLRATLQRVVERARARMLKKSRHRALRICRLTLGGCVRAAAAADDGSDITAEEWKTLLDQGLAALPPPSPPLPPRPSSSSSSSAAPDAAAAANAPDAPPDSDPHATVLLEAILTAMPFAVQRTELPRAVAALGADAWLGRVLLKLPPMTVEALTCAWEEAAEQEPPQAMQGFFAAIYGGGPATGGDGAFSRAELIRIHLFRAKAQFAKVAMDWALGLL